MRILFCNIAWMKEYRGNEDGNDIPVNGGSFVDETGDAHEKYNFTPVNIEGNEGLYCLGFFETKSHNGKDVNQMRIENIAGCELCKKEESIEDVLVVYCAKHPAHKFTTVVGWYKHATVFRHYQEAVFAPEDIQYYNAISKVSNCVLLPVGVRSKKVQWEVPRKSNGWAYGFGRANLDRKHFSKIQCDKNYHPKKKTVMALCIALQLDLEQSRDLLARADWAFSPSSKVDLIVQKAIIDNQYDIMQLNVTLFKYTNEILGV